MRTTDVLPINDDPRHQPGAPLTTYEKRTIVVFIGAVLLVGPLLALAVAGAVVGLVQAHPDAWRDAFVGVFTLLVVGGVLSPLLVGARR